MKTDPRHEEAVPIIRLAVSAILVVFVVILVALGFNINPQEHTSNLDTLINTNNWISSALITGNAITFIAFLLLGIMFIYIAIQAHDHIPFPWSLFIIASLLILDAISHALSAGLLLNPALEIPTTLSRLITAALALGAAVTFPPLIPKRIALYKSAAQALKNHEDLKDRNASLEEMVDNRTQEIQASRQHARELVGHVVAAEQNERARLSYDVHDGLTQTAVACFQRISATHYKHAQTGKQLVERGLLDSDLYNEMLEDIRDCERLAKLTVLDARTFIEDLRPTVLDDFGLPEAINQKVNQLQDEGWSISFTCTLPDPHYIQRPNPDAETALYRICQESLTNIKKHARATHVKIDLELTGIEGETPQAVLTITDNGHGFDPDLINRNDRSGPGERVGLQGMRERINLMQGALEIHTAPGRGTTIKATIPIKEQTPTKHSVTNDYPPTSTQRKDHHIDTTSSS